MLKKTLIGLIVIIAVFAVVVVLQPAEYHVERSATIGASSALIFEHVNDFHQWDAWSPWAKLDPNMKKTFEGPAAGTGAIYTWAGDSKVGEGRMTLTEARPSELVRIKLEFIKPFASTCTTAFEFKPQGNETTVRWTMDGRNNFIAKAFCLFMNMDKLVGGDFEKGLTQLKAIAEAKP